jgi:hypothetical protein
MYPLFSLYLKQDYEKGIEQTCSCQNEQKGFFIAAHPNLECLMILRRDSGTFDVALANKAHWN